MNQRALILSCIAMTFVGLLFLSEVRGQLNTAQEYEELAQFWKNRVATEQLRKLIVMGRFADFKQEVALLIPDQMKTRKVKEEKVRLRALASVIPHESNKTITLGYSAHKILEMGKRKIKQKEYDDGMKLLNQLIHKFPDSHHVIEAHYLVTEVFAHKENNIEVINWVDKMVELFPEDRLTGFALLKVGGVYEIDGRHEDAIRVYKTIIAVYKDDQLLAKAKRAVKELQL